MGRREDNADINEKIYRIRIQGLILRMRMERRELAERSFKSWLMWERYKMELRRERLEMRYNHNHDPKTGRFTSKSGASGEIGLAESNRIVDNKDLTEIDESDIIQEKELEYGVQYGEKAIFADMDYINSDEYKNKFSTITNIPAVNEALYTCAVDAIGKRNGTPYENIYFINAKTGEVLAMQLESEVKHGVTYNDEIKDLLEHAKEENTPLISIHNHPEGLPPSINDFNKSYENNTLFGVAVGHNGQVYKYDNPHKTISDADTIHEAMDFDVRGGIDPDRAYRNRYNALGLKYTIM